MIKITNELISNISKKAAACGRKRTNYNFHKSYDAVIQRLLNAAELGTYIQPHKHENPDKEEIFIMLRGKVVIVEFNSKGKIIDHTILDEKGGAKAVEIPPRTWHTFITLRPGSVLYEVKQGPYQKLTDKNFAAWAPKEGSPEAQEFIKDTLKKLRLKEEI